jgi:hypothetical protein
MRQISFDLSKYENISGTLILSVPTYRERLKMIKECNFKVSEEGNVNINSDTIDSLIKLLDVTEPFFKKIDLKCHDIKAKTFEDLETYSEFDALLSEAATSILNAGKLGK